LVEQHQLLKVGEQERLQGPLLEHAMVVVVHEMAAEVPCDPN